MTNIAVLGYGTVGSGVVEVLSTNKDSINKKAGDDITIKYVLDLREFPGTPVEKIITHDFEEILQDDSVSVLAEVMGGVEPAYTFTKKALLAGKSVVTSNKELVAQHGPELLSIAKEKEVNYLFEASVGGGIPIIRPLNNSLTADEIYEISGILNGTTNFILSKMDREKADYAEVLKEAQALGYAEKDPTADVEGHDACRKIAILSSLAFDMHVDFADIYTEGISKISTEDIMYAKAAGRDIKLIGTSKKIDHKVYAMVAPMMINLNHPLSHVNDVFNAIFVKGNVIGEAMFYGHGAGKLPTASAVVADVVDAVRHSSRNIMTFWSTEKMELMSIEDVPVAMFIRVKTDNIDGALEEAAKVFGPVTKVSLDGVTDEAAFMTDVKTEKAIADMIKCYGASDVVTSVVSTIRVQD